MFGTLRFRLPAFFLAGIALAGLFATAIAVGLFQDYVRDRSLAQLRREAAGLTQLYAEQALKNLEQDRPPAAFAARNLERASGNRLFYVGAPFVLRGDSGLRELPAGTVNWRSGRVIAFEFTPPREDRTFLAVAHPLRLGGRGPVFGALVVATPEAELRGQWLPLVQRLALAFLAAIAVAAALAWYLSRRITKPVLAISRAAEEVAEGRYSVTLPDIPARDEIGHLADRFREMAIRLSEAEDLERNFVMTVSHELRTPLTAIRGHVEALREGVVQEPEARAESLAVIASETERLERLVGDLLDLAKLGARRFTLVREEVDMGRLLDRAYSTFGEEARRRRIDYRHELESRPVVVSDGDRVLQIISNLLANAFRWTPDGGSIELALRAENGTVAVTVEDTGAGIDLAERDRIFRPFWTRDGGGTGLGLAIARELALALGGRIDVESAPGRGSRFELVLPGESVRDRP